MNLQALAAMDDCEHATGMTLEQHIRKTPKEIIARCIRDGFVLDYSDEQLLAYSSLILQDLRNNGYSIVQVVSSGNKHV